MYLEYLLLIFDYFKTLTKRVVLFEWIIPLAVSFVIFVLNSEYSLNAYRSFKEHSISILGVLLGFSIAVITIITTGSGRNIENIKRKKTEFNLNNTILNLYDLVLINFTYSVVVEILLIVCCLTLPLFSSLVSLSNCSKTILYSILVFGVLHILLLTLRNLTDFYFIITKKE